MRLEFLDTTLRDGAQARGIQFSNPDKLQVAEALGELGVSYIEMGNPAASPGEEALFRQLPRIPGTRLCAFGATRRKDISVEDDAGVQKLLQADTDTVVIFGKASLLHVREVLYTTPEENLRMIADTVTYFRAHGKQVLFDAEHFFDGYAQDPGYAVEALHAARGAARLVLCDTNGGSIPEQVARVTALMQEAFPDRLGIHCHDDMGLATACSIAAVQAGAIHVQGTLIGFGERCGNCSLSTLLPTLQFKYGYPCISADQMQHLTHICRKVAEIGNIGLHKNLPYVGENAFSHKAGMHGDGVVKLSRSFEHIEPALVGNTRRLVLSGLAGRSMVTEKVQQFLPEVTKDSPEVELVLNRLKELEQEGWTFEAAEASFDMLVRRLLGLYEKRYDILFFKVNSDYPSPDPNDATAIIKVRVGGKELLHAGEGAGPLNALDHALRQALSTFFPRIREAAMCDFKVRVLDPEASTAAKTRVLMSFTDGVHTWTTLGVSRDVLQASRMALEDAVEYKLLLDDQEEAEGEHP